MAASRWMVSAARPWKFVGGVFDSGSAGSFLAGAALGRDADAVPQPARRQPGADHVLALVPVAARVPGVVVVRGVEERAAGVDEAVEDLEGRLARGVRAEVHGAEAQDADVGGGGSGADGALLHGVLLVRSGDSSDARRAADREYGPFLWQMTRPIAGSATRSSRSRAASRSTSRSSGHCAPRSARAASARRPGAAEQGAGPRPGRLALGGHAGVRGSRGRGCAGRPHGRRHARRVHVVADAHRRPGPSSRPVQPRPRVRPRAGRAGPAPPAPRGLGRGGPHGGRVRDTRRPRRAGPPRRARAAAGARRPAGRDACGARRRRRGRRDARRGGRHDAPGAVAARRRPRLRARRGPELAAAARRRRGRRPAARAGARRRGRGGHRRARRGGRAHRRARRPGDPVAPVPRRRRARARAARGARAVGPLRRRGGRRGRLRRRVPLRPPPGGRPARARTRPRRPAGLAEQDARGRGSASGGWSRPTTSPPRAPGSTSTRAPRRRCTSSPAPRCSPTAATTGTCGRRAPGTGADGRRCSWPSTGTCRACP